jgi:hypothetical protein
MNLFNGLHNTQCKSISANKYSCLFSPVILHNRLNSDSGPFLNLMNSRSGNWPIREPAGTLQFRLYKRPPLHTHPTPHSAIRRKLIIERTPRYGNGLRADRTLVSYSGAPGFNARPRYRKRCLSPSRQMLGYLKLGHDRCLQNSTQIITHKSSNHSVLHVITRANESVK